MVEDVRESLPAGWVRDESGALRREAIHSMLRRLPGWNYRQPWIYQITLVCADRLAEPLGRLEVRREGWLPIEAVRTGRDRPITPEEIEARVVLSPLGAAIKELFWHFGDYTPEIKPLKIEIMPDHLHFIIRVTREMKRPLGNAIGGFKTGCEKLYRKLSLSGRDHAISGPGVAIGAQGRLFDEGFQDTILFHAGQLENMFRYLADNARRRAIKSLLPDLFRVVSRLGVDLRLSAGDDRKLSLSGRDHAIGGPGVAGGPGAIGGPGVAEKQGAADGSGVAEKQGAIGGSGVAEKQGAIGGPDVAEKQGAVGGSGVADGPVPRATARGWFSALGNRFLLGRPLSQVQVSRRDFGYKRESKPGGGLKISCDAAGEPIAQFSTPRYAEKRAALFTAAKHGAVLISPCISDGERQIAREALAAGLPLVALRNKGFSKLQKPSGRAFDACADGRLLMLAPAAWPYVPGEKAMTRFDATAMNRLCQWIVGEGAAEINYHGMRPADIDGLARAAAMVEEMQT